MLEIDELRVNFAGASRPVVDGVSLTLAAGQRLGVIGESGSGKSLTALAALGLLPASATVTGRVRLAGTDMVAASEKARAQLRGRVVSMIFQEPMTALDPTMRVGGQVAEVYRLHHRRSAGAHERALAMLTDVGLPNPAQIMRAYPHELSGGQRQRVLIAMALINSPALVLCDEPTTALDVTVQAKVLDVLDRALTQHGAACVFISHDIAVVARMCQQIAIMRAGTMVERGSVQNILRRPQHRYTQGLIAAARIGEVPPGERLPLVQDFLSPQGMHD